MKNIKTSVNKILLAVLAIVLIIILLLIYEENQTYENKGESLINKIENFRIKNKRLPNTVLELGEKEPMDQGPYYEKKDSVNYIIYFSIGFDEAKIYYSETKKWVNKP